MRPLILPLAAWLAASGSAGAATLSPVDCPYAADEVSDGYTALCQSMSWADQRTLYRTTVAIFTPEGGAADPVPVIYAPGGPGDAPVNEGGGMDAVLALFPGRQVITLNPRGTRGARPRPACDFEPDFWEEELAPERETEIVTRCRDSIELDMTRFDAPYLARDISRMVKALRIERAGIFGVSYGTESVLHLIGARPDWIAFAILDSVSLPGALGAEERLAARDRFLGIVDRLCFEERQCPETVVGRYASLLDWTRQFDADPLDVTVGPHKRRWSLDGQDMLDFLASMASYPDGAGYGPIFIEALEDARDSTGDWIASELEQNVEYALENFVLLFSAFSDSDERALPAPEPGGTAYPFDAQDLSEHARLFRVWNAGNRTEERFVAPGMPVDRPAFPILILSGGADTATPLDWALELERRFAGQTHFVFPELGHAVSFGTTDDVNDPQIARQLECGPAVVSAFVAGEPYGACEMYRREATDD